MFRTVRVDSNVAEALESVGTKRKFWFSQGSWLFKAEERGTGDWAEKIACELAGRIGLPHVTYELAEEYDGPTYRQQVMQIAISTRLGSIALKVKAALRRRRLSALCATTFKPRLRQPAITCARSELSRRSATSV